MTAWTRRHFLQVGGAALVALGWSGKAYGAPAIAGSADLTAATPDRILVVLELAGGNDGLNTVVPYGHGRYYDMRPGLAIAEKEVLPLTEKMGLHPSLKGLKALYDRGQLAILQGVGYPNPNRSHFRSMEIWQSGDPTGPPRTGWLGRYLDRSLALDPNPLKAVVIGSGGSRALVSQRTLVPALENIGQFRVETSRTPSARQRALTAFKAMYGVDDEFAPHLAVVRGRGQSALAAADAIQSHTLSYQSAAEYPKNGLATRLQTIAQLIASGLGTRVFYLTVGGFDDHASEKWRHGALLAQVDGALAAFWEDLQAHGLADRVTLMAYSEFGRRVRENASGGTDHGAAGPTFVMGARVKGGLIGEQPSLEDLWDGDLKHGIDYRSVYQTILEDWLQASGPEVLGARFETLPIF